MEENLSSREKVSLYKTLIVAYLVVLSRQLSSEPYVNH